jgi:Alpha/beta hydrolase domain
MLRRVERRRGRPTPGSVALTNVGTPAAAIGPALEGAPSLLTVGFDLASVGYAVHEHLVRGTAGSYTPAGPHESDGRWEVAQSSFADFTTRLVVYRPADPAHGNGTVIVEWLNVTGGLDVPALWMPTHRHLVRDGYSWVGVSAQRVGIEGGGMMAGLGLRQTAADRYGELTHPGDPYSFDIFTQAARAARELLPDRYGVRVDCVIAAGASQSAFHLTTYLNAIDQHARALDGYLLQGRAGVGAPLDGWTFERIDADDAANMEARRRRLTGRDQIRTDVRVPVIVVQSETDVFGVLAYYPARQPDTERFRLWEIAGAAHCDTYFLCAAPLDSGSLSIAELAALINRADTSGIPTEVPINAGPQMHYVLQRAFDALDGWIRSGSAPPAAPRLADAGGELARDTLGIGRGGVRTPWVDVPTAVLSGLGQPGDMNALFGTTRPIDPDALAARYPGGRDEYVEQFRGATTDAVAAGFLLPADAPEIVALGAAAWP